MTVQQINDWLSACFTDGLNDGDDLLEHLSVAMECLYMQGALSDHAFNEIYIKLSEAVALLSVVPKPTGWRIQTVWQSSTKWVVEITLPELFPSHVEAQLAAGSSQEVRFNDNTLTVITSSGREYSVQEQHINVSVMRGEAAKRALNWLQRAPVLASNGYERVQISVADLKNTVGLDQGFTRITDIIVPVFEFNEASPVFALGLELKRMRCRFSLSSHAKMVDGLAAKH